MATRRPPPQVRQDPKQVAGSNHAQASAVDEPLPRVSELFFSTDDAIEPSSPGDYTVRLPEPLNVTRGSSLSVTSGYLSLFDGAVITADSIIIEREYSFTMRGVLSMNDCYLNAVATTVGQDINNFGAAYGALSNYPYVSPPDEQSVNVVIPRGVYTPQAIADAFGRFFLSTNYQAATFPFSQQRGPQTPIIETATYRLPTGYASNHNWGAVKPVPLPPPASAAPEALDPTGTWSHPTGSGSNTSPTTPTLYSPTQASADDGPAAWDDCGAAIDVNELAEALQEMEPEGPGVQIQAPAAPGLLAAQNPIYPYAVFRLTATVDPTLYGGYLRPTFALAGAGYDGMLVPNGNFDVAGPGLLYMRGLPAIGSTNGVSLTYDDSRGRFAIESNFSPVLAGGNTVALRHTSFDANSNDVATYWATRAGSFLCYDWGYDPRMPASEWATTTFWGRLGFSATDLYKTIVTDKQLFGSPSPNLNASAFNGVIAQDSAHGGEAIQQLLNLTGFASQEFSTPTQVSTTTLVFTALAYQQNELLYASSPTILLPVSFVLAQIDIIGSSAGSGVVAGRHKYSLAQPVSLLSLSSGGISAYSIFNPTTVVCNQDLTLTDVRVRLLDPRTHLPLAWLSDNVAQLITVRVVSP